MSDQRWLAVFVAMIAVLLLIDGGVVYLGIGAMNTLISESRPSDPPQYLALAYEVRPTLYLRAFQAGLFGSIAIVAAVGLFRGRSWARGLWLWASAALVICAVVLVVIHPATWDHEGVLVGMCMVTGWYLWRTRPK